MVETQRWLVVRFPTLLGDQLQPMLEFALMRGVSRGFGDHPQRRAIWDGLGLAEAF